MLEKLCRNQHFQDNFVEYKNAFQKAIESDAIDMLEILIPAGNAKRLQPLHISSKLARLESTEVLLSAGFSCLLQDELGRTPLHLCCESQSSTAGLCATLLSLSGKKALTIRDRNGLTPLHRAAALNNLKVIEALMTSGADITVTSSSGQTAYQVAAANENYEALQLLKDLVASRNAATTQKSKSKSKKGGQQQQGRPQTQAEYDRIMQVWERFFENAFKRMGMDPDELDEEVDRYTASPSTSSRTVTSSARQDVVHQYEYAGRETGKKSTKKGAKKGAEYKNDAQSSYEMERRKLYGGERKAAEEYWDYGEEKPSRGASRSTKNADIAPSGASTQSALRKEWDAAPGIDWFEWVVRYLPPDATDADANDAGSYYVVHKVTGESAWLEQHTDRFMRSTLLPCDDWADYELHMSYPLPVTLSEAVTRGWLTYYSAEDNACRWISIPTKSTEEYLPLGVGEDPAVLHGLGLRGGDADMAWYSADQSLAQAWVLVVAPSDPDPRHISDGAGGEVLYYYRNLVTTETRWEAPPGWEQLLQSWEGWTLCCNEDSPESLYW
jgi:hypothetical protein